MLLSQFHEFLEFVKKTNFLSVALALTISTNVQQIINSIVTNLLNPLIRTAIQVDNLSVKVGNIEFRLGNILNSILTFVIVLYLFFLMFKYSTALASGS